MIDGVEQRHVTARDGTRIGYQVRGPKGAPAVVFANGLGGTYLAFKYLYEGLGDYHTICWDYRGLYTSAASADPISDTLTQLGVPVPALVPPGSSVPAAPPDVTGGTLMVFRP